MLRTTKYASPSAVAALLTAAVLLLFTQSCNKDLHSSEEDTATVTLTFSAGSPLQQDSPVSRAPANSIQGEGIKTLRVIMAKKNSEGKVVQVLRNEKRTYGDDATVRTLTLFDVPLGLCTFYVIANEESVNKVFTTDYIREELNKAGGSKLLFEDLGNQFFPFVSLDGTPPPNGLPISGHEDVEITKDMPPLTLMIRRAVAKLNLTIKNNLKSDLTLQQLNFGQFFANKLYVFSETSLDVPEDAGYKVLSVSEQLRAKGIPGGGTCNCTIYMYPSYAWKSGQNSPYTLALVTAEGAYPPVAFVDGKTSSRLNSIARNTQVNISASIQTSAKVTVDFEVTSWIPENVNVPPFN